MRMGVIHFNMEESCGSESHATKLAATICILCPVTTLLKQHICFLNKSYDGIYCFAWNPRNMGLSIPQSSPKVQLLLHHSELPGGSHIFYFLGVSSSQGGREYKFQLRSLWLSISVHWTYDNVQTTNTSRQNVGRSGSNLNYIHQETESRLNLRKNSSNLIQNLMSCPVTRNVHIKNA